MLYLVRPAVCDCDPLNYPPPPPRLIATGPATAAMKSAELHPAAAASLPAPVLSCAGGTSALALLLHAASGEGGEDGDVLAHVTCEGSVVMSFGVGEAAPQLTCRLLHDLDPLSLSSLVFEFSCSSSPPLPLQPHAALAVAAVDSGGSLNPAEWASAFVRRIHQCCALYGIIVDETRTDIENNFYQIEFADSATASAFTLFILPHSHSTAALQPLTLFLPLAYPHVSPQPRFSAASSHLRSRFLTLMQQHSQPWPVSLMVRPPPPPLFHLTRRSGFAVDSGAALGCTTP
jgi:hypothetical protein